MANPTTYFGWVMPNSADLVTDLPADFAVFGQGVDTSMQYLLGGTTGQVLSKTSGTNMAFTWINNDQGDITGVTAGTGITVTSPTGPVPTVAIDTTVTVDKTTAQTLTNKTLTSPALTTPTISTATTNGDILYGTGSGALARLGIGSASQVLTVASGIPSWATPASGSTGAGTGVYLQSTATISNNTDTFINWDTELWDTNAYHSTASNLDRFTIPAGAGGYYLLSCIVQFAGNTTGLRSISVAKNGATGASRLYTLDIPAYSSTQISLTFSVVVKGVPTDYFGVYVAQTSGGNLSVYGTASNTSATTASFMYLGA